MDPDEKLDDEISELERMAEQRRKALKRKEAEAEALEQDSLHKSCLLPCLTYHIEKSSGYRAGGALEPDHEDWIIDKMKFHLPKLSDKELKKVLKDAGGDYNEALKLGKSVQPGKGKDLL